ncbi:hypothetical protein Tco_0275892, partial [Tanacetum coccineum]
HISTLYDESEEDSVDEDDIVDLGNDGEIRNENLDDMLEYARMDVHYLLYIADCLVAELKLQKNVWTSNDLSKSEKTASLDDNKFNFVYEASRRSNAVCLQLFTKELEASPGQSATSSIISRHLNDPGSSTDNGQFACLREEDIYAENPETRSWDEQNAFANTADMEKSGCKEIDLTSLADTFNLQATHSDPTNQSVRENDRAAEHKESQQIEEYIGNGEKAADVNRDEDGSCLAGGAIRMDSEPSGQGSDMDHRDKVEHGGPIKQMVLKTRCDMDADIVPLHSVEHRGPVNQMVLKTRCDMDGGIVPLRSVEHGGLVAVGFKNSLCMDWRHCSPCDSVEHGGIKRLVLKIAVIWMAALSLDVQLNMAGLLSGWRHCPLRSVEHGGPIKRLVLKTRCDMDGGIVPLRSVEHGGPIKQLVLKTRCDMDGGIVPLRSVEHGGPIKQLVLKTRCDMDGGIVPLRSVEHGGPIKQLVLKTRCDMDGGIVPLCSVEHRGPIKQMVLKTRCDMDRGIVPLSSVKMTEEDAFFALQHECGVCPDNSYARGWRGLIFNGMSDFLFDVYQNVETSKELWDTLESKYMAENASSKKFLVSNFTNYKMTDSKPVLKQYNKLLGILGRFTQHKMNMDESIQVSCIIDKLPLLKQYNKLLGILGSSHLRIEKSPRAQDSDKPKGNNVAGHLVVNMVEALNSSG